jgi:transcriptional regulator CtsR
MDLNKDKKIALITDEISEDNIESIEVSNEELQREVDYVHAQQILKRMLEKKLITEAEFNKITALNRETFSPFLAAIMP